MERVLVGRQPIFRADMNVLGYELLFRDDEMNRASFSDGDQATAEVILNTFTEIGLEKVVGQWRSSTSDATSSWVVTAKQFHKSER